MGLYLRNELGYKGLSIIEPFVAYDFGYVKNNKIVEDYKRRLQGLTLGARISYKNFEGSIALSKAIDKPSFFKEDSAVVYTSLTYKF
ncbi:MULTISPECIES: ShlB/FhaC/HecB family hemolysin secretion/activation protein [Fusobacterium]|uniref:ShlB/FhaC/HecB family hemolysin secretion/activation protein n=1 Tax=Fusobacterium TaxID=848 RepID=UPI0025C6E72F|nr:ShlB/FhaC/HecB family hemolysin secretion/activation protein [Fusobacterium sp.]MDD7410890.1 ShlB/FhaC/HecB family hemolysin secretion/activation protein [Fusobacteriaceae bacterium]MDY5713243.1 ShlB/FhaC/HecB family hemolysin secretion/activation protein [Fusobacterium gastrosuis]